MKPGLLSGSGINVSVKVHPVVMFAMCDAYIRRNEKQERVIGTLLGMISDGVVEVKNCYVVPHNESSDQVAVDINHHKTLFELHQKVAPQELIVGWFSTGNSLSNSDALIHDFYVKEAVSTPIHLIVDTALTNKAFAPTAYVSRTLILGEKVLASEFIEVPCDVVVADMERMGVDVTAGPTAKPPGDAEALQASLRRLQDLVNSALAFANEVVEGKRVGDPTLGRYLADTLAAVPHLAREDFEKMFNDNMQDLLLVTYLSNLVRSHLALAEKLGTTALPIL